MGSYDMFKLTNSFYLATALMRNKKTSKTAKDAKRKIDMVTRTMSKRAGSDLPFEFDMGDGSFDVALDTFNKANGQLYELAAGYPAVKRAASDSVKSQVSVVWDQPVSCENLAIKPVQFIPFWLFHYLTSMLAPDCVGRYSIHFLYIINCKSAMISPRTGYWHTLYARFNVDLYSRHLPLD